ncbi:siderophore biosynthesis protein [Nostoc sp. WHI]|uniref:siderophore biosynthesis protein n=1 Tax=Nostoc sp. WHI TaxID=2650611 RepID=UPI0018C689AD|nr:siderophore biosynthesis protein [Nostoc sp. WHI]MBG1266663.1 siderophore biosynthesis protein [Nostoc sp. WHI]
MTNVEAIEIWKKSHWTFSVYIQCLIICLGRFQMEIEDGNINGAGIELETAAELMLASAAAMELAGIFTRHIFEENIRPMMMPPNVRSEDFSGLMHWDHTYLMTVLKKIQPLYKTLPASLQPQHNKFISAYKVVCASHKAVCQKFGGDEAGSLRAPQHTAVDMLDKFEQNRLRLIDPNGQLAGGCPFHVSKSSK